MYSGARRDIGEGIPIVLWRVDPSQRSLVDRQSKPRRSVAAAISVRIAHSDAFMIVAIPLLVTLLVGVASRSPSFSDFNLWAYDFVTLHKQAAQSSQTVIVDFDDATIAKIRRFPVPRDLVAEVVSRVAQARAKVIGLDILLSEEGPESEDAAMETSLTRAGNVVLASRSGSGAIPAIEPLLRFCEPNPAHYGDCRAGALGFAPINLPLDHNGFVRRITLFSLDEHEAESFPVRIAELFTGTPLIPAPNSATFAGHTVPYADGARTVLIGSWGVTPALSISALRVLEGKAPMRDLTGKIVLVGQSNYHARDWEFTPLFRASTPTGVPIRLSRAQIHAASIATLLDGTAIHPLSRRPLFTVSFTVTCLAVWMLLRFRPRYSIAGTIALMVCCYLAAQLLFNVTHRWFQFIVSGACIALAVPFTFAYQLLREGFRTREAVAERAQVMRLFARYVAPEVADEIWRRRSELVLAGEERVITILFSDIRSFTASSAGKPSEMILAWLNNYFTAMDEVIREEGGFVNKFIGDGLMVLFGLPLSKGVEEDAAHALRAAIRMLERVQQLNLTRPANSDWPSLKIGIGVHTGQVTSGNIGSRNRLEYSVIGDSVNLASRLESLTKDFEAEIVLSETTYEYTSQRFSGFRDLGLVPVRGFRQAMRLYTMHLPSGHQTASEYEPRA